MNDFYTNYIISLYNTLFQEMIINSCECYKMYKDFDQCIFKNQNDYFCCIQLSFKFKEKTEKKISHRTLPVMLGSYIDYSIRGEENLNYHQFGCFIIGGFLRNVQNFLTNNLRNCYIYYNRKFDTKQVIFHDFDYENKLYMKLSFNKKISYSIHKINPIQYTRQKISLDDKKTNMSWITFYNNINPYKKNCTEQEIIDYLKQYLENGPHLDDLQNKICLPSPAILHKAIMFFVDRVTDPSHISQTINNIKITMKRGNLYFILTNQTIYKLSNEYQCIYNLLEGHKITTPYLYNDVVKRNVSIQTKNCKALEFYQDGKYYIDSIYTKELCGAGEHFKFSMVVFPAMPIKISSFINSIKFLSSKNKPYRVALYNYITDYYLSLEDIKKIKQKNTFLSFQIFKRNENTWWCCIYNEGYSVMKYSKKYKIFITPFEYKFIYKDAFDPNDIKYNFCNKTACFPQSFVKTLPPKLVVSLNNIRGACSVIKDQQILDFFINSIGYNNSLIHNQSLLTNEAKLKFKDHETALKVGYLESDSYLKFAVLSENNQYPKNLIDFFIKFKNIHKTKIHDDVEEKGFKLSSVLPKKDWNIIKKNIKNINNYNFPKKYIKLIDVDLETSAFNGILLYTVFGDIEGYTNEDGIILDKSFVENGPMNLISMTLNVHIKHSKYLNKKSKPLYGKINYKTINQVIGDYMVFGIIQTCDELSFNSSKNVIIRLEKIKNIYNYRISIENFSSYPKVLESYINDTGVLTIHYHHFKKIGIGSKITNVYGQKGIVSAIKDLSTIKAYDFEGKLVHPQIMFSPISIIGRSVASQVYEMLMTNKVAITESFCLVSPIHYNIHNIESSTKGKLNSPMQDLLTVENGFLANHLANTSQLLNENKEKHAQTFDHIIELLKFNKINTTFIRS